MPEAYHCLKDGIHHEKQNNGRALKHTGLGIWGIYCMHLKEVMLYKYNLDYGFFYVLCPWQYNS